MQRWCQREQYQGKQRDCSSKRKDAGIQTKVEQKWHPGQHAFGNQAVEEPAQRAELQSYLGLGTRRADLIVRFGRGPTLARSLRRPVDDVIVS